ncbi:MAG TPA: hypothetical protein VJG85_00470 [Patescibacteria group bacterium]|nr:hypothetical protein [Patescibacteria group bacterium]
MNAEMAQLYLVLRYFYGLVGVVVLTITLIIKALEWGKLNWEHKTRLFLGLIVASLGWFFVVQLLITAQTGWFPHWALFVAGTAGSYVSLPTAITFWCK